MAIKVEDYIQWPELEALEYAECANPELVLGPRAVDAKHMFVGVFFPKASEIKIKVNDSNRSYPMKKYSKTGYFAAIIPVKKLPSRKADREKMTVDQFPKYKLTVTQGKQTSELIDPYTIESMIDAMDRNKFVNGIHEDITSILGAKVCEIDGVKGTHFAVWAPNARAVSVVGPFNDWDKTANPMSLLEDCGIYELFIPGLAAGEKYQYRILNSVGKDVYKTDPLGRMFDLRPEFSAIVYDG